MRLTGTKDERVADPTWRRGSSRGAGSGGGTSTSAHCCREARRPMGVAAVGALLALLVPKCPMCLAAYLSFLGVAATGLVWLRPLGVVLMLAGVTVAAWRTLTRSS